VAKNLSILAPAIVAFGQLSNAALAQPLKCETGPISKTYGSTPWLVYSCSDNKSVVLLSAPGSPATPFYFMFSPSNGAYQLQGEGTGDKNATAAAAGELQKLSSSEIGALIEQTKAGGAR
jgi:hypothetical protein